MNAAARNSVDSPAAYFDRLAPRYDQAWSNAPAGRLQREAVWRHLDPLVAFADRILDLGCGTGEDAVHLSGLGAHVSAIDTSAEMVRAACAKGVNARQLRIEDTGGISGVYDLIFSNFGALNCVDDLATLRGPLARLLRPGGRLAICLMNRFCLWESVYYAMRAQFGKASRRWRGASVTSSGLRVYYPSLRTIKRAFAPSFRFVSATGIGVCVPPSFVEGLPAGLLNGLGSIDARIGPARIARAIGDHRLLVFVRS
jgi:SAM-dependent methyltransferase